MGVRRASSVVVSAPAAAAAAAAATTTAAAAAAATTSTVAAAPTHVAAHHRRVVRHVATSGSSPSPNADLARLSHFAPSAKWEGLKPTPFEMCPRWGMVQVRRRRRRPRVRCAHQLGESAENQAECRQICQISESDQLKVVRNHAIGVFWRPVAQLPLGRSAQNLALPAVSRRGVSADVTWRAHRRKAE